MDEQNLVEKVFNTFVDSFGRVLQTFNGNLQLSTLVKLLTRLVQEEKCLAFWANNMNNNDNVECLMVRMWNQFNQFSSFQGG